jgi:membrane fusion protein (multidrug efflux system)
MRVPQTGVVHDQKGQATVLTVDAEDKVQLKIVTASRTLGRDWVVEDGINPGDRVIVQGVEKVRPGMKVKPVPAH